MEQDTNGALSRLDSMPDALTPEQTRRVLGIGRDKVYACIKQGIIPSVNLLGTRRVPKAALRRLLEEGWQQPRPR